MASLDGIQTRQALAQNTGKSVGTNGPVALRIRNKAKVAVTSVTVTTATDITLIDAVGTTAVDWATYGTLGAVADKINSTTDWECILLDALRADLPTNALVAGAIVASVVNGVTVYDAVVDTSVYKAFTVRCTLNPVPSQTIDNSDRRVRLNEFDYFATLGAAAGDMVQVYETKGGIENKVLSKTSVSANLTQNYLVNGVTLLDSGYGAELVVRLKDASSLADAPANFLQVNWRNE